jgi:HSP20 family protein
MANIVRWEPFRESVTLRQAMDRLFEDSFVRPIGGRLLPAGYENLAVDMYQTDDAVVVKATVPGIKAEDLDISITGEILTIKGETKSEEEVKEENYIRRERRYGSFCRSLAIPVPVVSDKAEAEFENGVLRLTLPKAEEVRPKSIAIKAK